jgi:deoxyuridine 5'-triphosphate nucleotidohydrolase
MSEHLPKFKFLLNDGLSSDFLPTKATETDTGWDVRSAEELIIKPMEYVKIDLGFRMFAPPGWWLELKPRSSSFAKKHLHALYGTIDESYEGPMIFAAQYIPDRNIHPDLHINKGDAIGQLLPIRRQEMLVEQVTPEEFETLCKQRNAKRGTGGFGSTGK